MASDGSHQCPNCKIDFLFNTIESEYVCTSCGLVGDHSVLVFPVEDVSKLPAPDSDVAPIRTRDARKLAVAQRALFKCNSAYNRRYYSNERISQITNTCPEIKKEELLKIAHPLLFRSSDPELAKYYNFPPEKLTQTDIVTLVTKAHGVRNERAERWIQIKWRVANCPVWDEVPLERPRDPADWKPEWPWRPDLLPSHLVSPLNIVSTYLRDAFKTIVADLKEAFPIMFQKPLARSSMINWPWMINRILHMLCPGCKGKSSHEDPACWGKRFCWALKPLATSNNVDAHICWWYFLILYLARVTQYDAPILPGFKWEICTADPVLSAEAITSEKFRKLWHQIVNQLSPTSPNPDLIPFPLRRESVRKSLRQFRRVSKEAEHKSPKRQRLQT